MPDLATERQQAENELALGKAHGNDELVKAAEKRLAALGDDRSAEPEKPQARKRQTSR